MKCRSFRDFPSWNVFCAGNFSKKKYFFLRELLALLYWSIKSELVQLNHFIGATLSIPWSSFGINQAFQFFLAATLVVPSAPNLSWWTILDQVPIILAINIARWWLRWSTCQDLIVIYNLLIAVLIDKSHSFADSSLPNVEDIIELNSGNVEGLIVTTSDHQCILDKDSIGCWNPLVIIVWILHQIFSSCVIKLLSAGHFIVEIDSGPVLRCRLDSSQTIITFVPQTLGRSTSNIMINTKLNAINLRSIIEIVLLPLLS